MQTAQHADRSRAKFQMPEDMGKRIKEARKGDLYKGARHKADIIAYGVGCTDGEEEARAFYRGLMEKHPNVYGGRLASLLMDAAGLQLDGTMETSYRRGWLVGIAFALECWLYEDACRRHGG
ncbi:MAG: hypothetical protein JNL84_03745 [Candidatus Accumulibacter sp.]|nr:hypothetical protein [Accumulibacter sp.]